MQITSIRGREILDSRGNPTIEAEVGLDNGVIGRASVPSGASRGSREAHELRDHNALRYAGKGMRHSVAYINEEINSALKGFPVDDQAELDAFLIELDGSPNKSRLGANTVLAVSLASARAYANSLNQPLYMTLNEGQKLSIPVPMMNVLNGGAHADNTVDIQEFMLIPVGANNFADALRMGAEVFYALKAVLKKLGFSTAVGDEGGFAPDLSSNQQALDVLMQAIELAGYVPKRDIVFALDIAASELFREGSYYLASENKAFSSEKLIDYYANLIQNYPIVSIEDGLCENDCAGWQAITQCLGKVIQLVGDDLFVTNAKLLQEGINQKVANAILIKLNQIGTLTETREAIGLAQANNYRCIISHRSGETEDTFIADLAVATGCGQIKTGSLCRTDRVAKYNQLLRISENTSIVYAGDNT